MSTKTGFISNLGTPYAYLQDSNNASVAMGLDSAGSDVFKIAVSTAINAVPTTSPQFLIDPAANGNVTVTPHGLGQFVVSYLTAGVVQSTSTGGIESSNGTNGQLLIGGGTAPLWANITSTGGTVAVTNGANTINLEVAVGTHVIETVTGNTGGAISPTAGNINIVTANSNVKFAGSGSTETLDFGPSTNLALGSALPSLSSGTNNTAVGKTALAATTSGQDMTAVGYLALENNTSGNSNTAIGSQALLTLNVAAGHGYNTAVGAAAGFSLATGEYNALMGASAGLNYTTSESSNIIINHNGVVGDSNTLRIGATTGSGNQSLNKAFICGIDGVNVGSVAKVVTMASNQLGTANITGGTNISVSTGANTITINGTGPAGFSWVVTAGGTAGVNTGYFTSNGASLVTITLPGTAAVGDTIRISGLATGGWKLAQNAGQSVNFISQSTTVGVGGSLASTAQYDSIEFVCCVANTTFNVVSSVGNITVV